MRVLIAIICAASFLLVAGSSAVANSKEHPELSGNKLNMPEIATPVDPPGSELTEQGRNVRGIYIPVGKVKSWNARRLVRWAQQTRANAVILDAKDDMGRVVFRNDLPHAQGRPHGYNPKLGNVVKKMQEAGIYVIARVVCYKDNILPMARPGTGIVDSRTRKSWRDRGDHRWADPHSEIAREHIVSVSAAAAELGFDEIQLDYIRFPVDKETKYARFPNRTKEIERYEVIAETLRQVDEAISIPLSIDVFGLTAYHPNDSEALGQRLEYLAPHVDVISPMVYLANWPQNYYENPKPHRTHQVIKGAVEKIRERLGDDIAVRPLLQAFKWRADNWGYAFIMNQIDAALGGGSSGHLFWNAGGRYRLVQNAWSNMDRNEDTPETISRR